ncbi:aminoacyl-tRNA deacylase [Garicola koreensis]|uniref:Cys-tRNA(Pro) deacylase n=1 Tax=Garicola koreensis TaxID=1262554 RepID=A0A7W5XL87_9MICC|nr:YbaK/EbsC family protein [Garicola koreensis]MBB3667820.1 Cys-tRNA(Pro) deacylase [Garicola koreensis]
MSEMTGRQRVAADAEARGVSIEFAPRGQASSLEEAAANLGIEPRDIVKTLVAKAKLTQTATEHSYVIALIPGDKQVDWAKLRKLAGMKKLSMASPDDGFAATGYYPGTITPFGAAADDGAQWPIYADESITGRISMGAGEPDLSLFVDAGELVSAYGIITGDISK